MSGAELANEFLAHWRALPRDSFVPSLSAFLDRPHPRFSPWLFILDVVSEENLPVRLFGTRMADVTVLVSRRQNLHSPLIANAARALEEAQAAPMGIVITK